ncbi:MAG: polysaccharide biosynthesis tyrosine autokinase, partial [Candidatus Omnitrophica bacterium]|nr:polysaccharide biosynthesis tyrosine autokinase [Candidatus Omnitrophota bacterium]
MNNTHTYEDLHLKDYLDILRRRFGVFILFFVTTILIVTVGNFIMTPTYRATAVILIDPESPNVLTTTGTVELQSQNYYSYREYYQSQMEILTSYSLIKKVYDEFGIAKQEEYVNCDEPLKKFMKTIRTEPIRDTRLVKLHVDNKDPVLAANIANRIAALFVMRNLYYISKNELMNLLKNEYLKLEAKMSEYEKVYKSGHPEMIRLKKEMDEMTAKIEDEKKSIYNFDNIEEYAKQGSAHALAGFKANNITIQDQAVVPVKPVRPKKALNIILSVIVGLFGGIGLAFFFDYLDDTARTVDHIEGVTRWPFLGSVPNIDRAGKFKESEKDVFVNIRPKDPISEIYRIIRTRILFTSTEERPVKSILITSPGPQEGKTVTLCNLGIAMAQNRQRVLLVDADMRRPRLHEAFGAVNEIGLSSILSGQVSLDKAIQKTGIENVCLIAGGVVPPNPSELLAGHRMKELIDKAKEKFDFVLFDSPPIGMLTDAVIVAGLSDGVIVVVESGKTSKRILARIHQLLDHAKAKVIGMVFNKTPVSADTY